MGLFATTAERPESKIHQLHRVEEQRNRRVQDSGPGRFGEAVGHPEEPPVDELRQDVQGAAILLQSEHFAEGARRAPLLPVSVLFVP